MIFLRRNAERLHKQDNWKKSSYAFVPYQNHFGELCGFADDTVLGGRGFGMHPHQNMEISTIVMRGSQVHKDDTGGEGIIHPNSIQTMSAGTGIMHSEFNASQTEPFHSYQIWVYPRKWNVEPRHETFSYQPEAKRNRFLLALSPDRRDHSALINQDAFFSVSSIEKDVSLSYDTYLSGNGVYIHCVSGGVTIEGHTLSEGDAIGVAEKESIAIQSLANAELILLEVPMQRGIQL